jgi:hypothetical protein
MFNQLDELLGEEYNTYLDDRLATFEVKRRCINDGIRALYPRVWRTIKDDTIVVDDLDELGYALPAVIAAGQIIDIEASDPDTLEYYPLTQYDISPYDEDGTSQARLWMTGVHHPLKLNSIIRVHAVVPFTPITETQRGAWMTTGLWVGPDDVMHLPVYYAMALLLRMPRVQRSMRHAEAVSVAGVAEPDRKFAERDFLAESREWMALFEKELSAKSRPLPVSRSAN